MGKTCHTGDTGGGVDSPPPGLICCPKGVDEQVVLTNYTCVKYSMAPQAYKVVNTHSHKISVFTIISIILHSRAPHFRGENGDVKSDLSTLAFNNI